MLLRVEGHSTGLITLRLRNRSENIEAEKTFGFSCAASAYLYHLYKASKKKIRKSRRQSYGWTSVASRDHRLLTIICLRDRHAIHTKIATNFTIEA